MIDNMLTYFNDDTLTRMFGDLADALYIMCVISQDDHAPSIAAIEKHIETLATETQRRKEEDA